MKINSKSELILKLSDVVRKGWNNRNLRDLIDSLWRAPVSIGHTETGNATVESTAVSVDYDLPFDTDTYYLSIQAFRVVAIPGAGNVRQDIPYHSLNQTTDGFELTLAEYEEGDVVRYYACE